MPNTQVFIRESYTKALIICDSFAPDIPNMASKYIYVYNPTQLYIARNLDLI